MIEAVTSENGSVVLRQNGRLLASAVNPQAEAAEWLVRRAEFLNDVKSIFVLGAGSGYHVAEILKKTNASVIVIERSSDIQAAVSAIHTFDSHRVRFECIEKARQLRASTHVKSAIGGSFLVMCHAPSCASAPEFYRECKSQLLGRDWGSLNWQWQLHGYASLDAQPKIHSGGDALTIYDLEQTELVQNSDERERMLIKALRELVK